MNYRYGHLEDGQLVYAKGTVTVGGTVYVNPPAEVYLRLDPPEKLLVDEEPQEPAQEGFHWAPAGWDEAETELRRRYAQVPDPAPEPEPEPDPGPQPGHRVFSKLYLELALFKAGLLGAVDEFIDSQVLTNDDGDTMPLRRAYDTALTFSEDNEYFSRFLGAVKEALGLPDQLVE